MIARNGCGRKLTSRRTSGTACAPCPCTVVAAAGSSSSSSSGRVLPRRVGGRMQAEAGKSRCYRCVMAMCFSPPRVLAQLRKERVPEWPPECFRPHGMAKHPLDDKAWNTQDDEYHVLPNILLVRTSTSERSVVLLVVAVFIDFSFQLHSPELTLSDVPDKPWSRAALSAIS